MAEVLAEVARLQHTDHLRARLTLGALVQSILQDDWDIVVVGGTAVDVYVAGAMGTSESYPGGWEESLDIDTIVMQGLAGSDRSAAVAVLERHGFVPNAVGTGVRHPAATIPIDFVGFGYPDDYSRDHAYAIEVQEWDRWGLRPLLVAGPEDILFDYVESGWDTRHQRDWTRALAIVAGMEEDLDLGYLISKAEWRRDGAFIDAIEKVLRREPLAARG